MAKQKNKKKQNKSRLFQIVVIVVVVAFIILLLSNLFSNSKQVPTKKNVVDQADLYKFKKQGELTFQTSEGNYISRIDIEFADNAVKRSDGLMLRTEMGENQGMLFIFPSEEMQSFWMKNTIISLDMLFINSDLEIVTIHKNTEPFATTSYPSTKPSQYVLETLAGYTDKYKVNVGNKVIFRKTN